MNKKLDEAREFILSFQDLIEQKKHYYKNINFGIAGNFLILSSLNHLAKDISNLKIYAQNCYYERNGAFTGEVSYDMLEDININDVIIGHSERRHTFHEDLALIHDKVVNLFNNDFSIILCVGERLEEYGRGETAKIITQQITTALDENYKINFGEHKLIIAYEPVWAVNTGRVAKTTDIENVFSLIRNNLKNLYGEANVKKIPFLYGGSVNENNCESLLKIKSLDGFLIGGASLDVNMFLKIADIAYKYNE